jgi:hypothetical protein
MKKLLTYVYTHLIEGIFTKDYWIAEYPYSDDM